MWPVHLLAHAVAAPPEVVRLSPANRDPAVDPSVAELAVTFDQPMRPGSWSWTGGGPSFPKVDGDIRYRDATTCVMPVDLEPGRLYALGINSARHHNFRSATGEAAVPVPWIFATAGNEVPAALHEGSVDAAIAAMRLRYSYQDRLKVDWEAALAPIRAKPLSAAGFALTLATELERAEDIHISVELDGRRLGTWSRSPEPNFDRAAVQPLVTEEIDHSTFAGEVDGVPYLLVTSWEAEARHLDRLDRWVTSHCDEPIIIDVRPNAGGDEPTARRLAARFVDETTVYAAHRTRLSDGSFSPLRYRRLEPAGRTCRGPVVVLMGPVCLSSNESFLLMMRAAGATLVGEHSGGSSGNPDPIELPNEVVMQVPSWVWYDAQERPMEGVGITPDVLVPWQPGVPDPVLRAAVEQVKSRGG